MQINSTELAGLLAFAPTALLCVTAARSSPKRQRRDWAMLAGLYALLTVEIVASGRHRLDGLLAGWLRAEHLYPDRRPVQAAAILLLIALGWLAARHVVQRGSTRRLRIARAATAAVILLFAIESVSLHAVDGLLYRPVGPILLIGWLWLVCGWTTAAAASSSAVSPNAR